MAGVDRVVGDRRAQVLAGKQRVLARARFLEERDRRVVELLLRGDLTRSDMAALIGVNASTLTRRVQRVVARLHDPMVVALIEGRGALPDEHRQLGVEHFLQGKSIGELAELHRMSEWEVRRMVEQIRGWFAGLRAEIPNGKISSSK